MEEVSSPSKTVKSKRVVFSDLDVVKFLMAFLVVEIHTRPFGISSLVQGIDCIAVPFFFIASAFLCFRGVDVGQFSDGESGACFRVRKTIKKLLMLYVAWTVIYIPVSLFGYALNGLGPTAIFVSFVRGTVFVGENVYSWPLWYLLASAVAFFLVFILLRGGGASCLHSRCRGGVRPPWLRDVLCSRMVGCAGSPVARYRSVFQGVCQCPKRSVRRFLLCGARYVPGY